MNSSLLVRDLKPHYWLVSNSPAVMPRRNRAHITGAKYLFFPVIHSNTHSARNDIQKMVFLTAFGQHDGFYVL